MLSPTGGCVAVPNLVHAQDAMETTGYVYYLPPPDANGVNYASIPFQVSDGKGAPVTGSAVVNIDPVNDPPITTATSPNPVVIPEDGSLTITLGGSDVDHPGNALQFFLTQDCVP